MHYPFLGYYIYIETSSPRVNNDSAAIISPALDSSGKYCVSFWYNMYGVATNLLNLYVKHGNYYGSPRWSMHGNQGEVWLYEKLEIDAQKGDTVSCIYMVS